MYLPPGEVPHPDGAVDGCCYEEVPAHVQTDGISLVPAEGQRLLHRALRRSYLGRGGRMSVEL